MEDTISNKLDKYLGVSKTLDSQMLNEITYYIYSLDSKKNDLYLIFKILGEENALNFISYFSGDTIKVPSKKEVKEAKLLAVTFYLRVVQEYTWSEIRDLFNFEFKEEDTGAFDSWELDNFKTISKKINTIKDDILKKFSNIQNTTYNEKEKDLFKNYLLRE